VSYLLDTDVVSELRRKLPNPSVVSWFSHRPASTLFLSVLTLGELRKGMDGAGRPLPAIDMAATAAQHGLSLVTRNARDFEGLGVEVINPWGG
jgi:predicted nucleic acid-binding protein